jgi:uncharacterized protein YggE
MSFQYPDRISTEVSVDTRVRASGATFRLEVTGTATIGTMATIKKNKELVAIAHLLGTLHVPEERMRIEAVSFSAQDGWLGGSSVRIEVEINAVPIDRAAEMLAGLSTMKSVKLEALEWEFDDLSAERDALLIRAVEASKRQAMLIADAAGVPLHSIYSMSQKWAEPLSEGMSEEYERGRGMMMSKSRSAGAPPDASGYQFMQNHEGLLGITMKMEFRIGEFAA